MALVLVDGLRILLDNKRTTIYVNNMDTVLDINNRDTDMVVDQRFVLTNVDNSAVGLNQIDDNIDVNLACGSVIIPKDELMQKIAGGNIGGFRCVVANSVGEILHADVAHVLAGKEIIGVSTQAAQIGTLCDIAITGDEIIEPSWNWDTDKSIYASEFGVLTQTVPTENYMQMIAIPLSPTSIRIRIEPSIFI